LLHWEEQQTAGEIMFKKLKLSAKVGLGFGTVLVLLALVAWFGYSGAHGALDGLIRYRDLARENIKASDLSSQLLTARIDVKDYYATKSDTAVKNYEKTAAHMNELLAEAQKEIDDPQRAEKLAAFASNFQQYDKTVHAIIALNTEANAATRITQLEEQSVRLGAEMVQATAALRDATTQEQAKLGAQVQKQVQSAVTLISVMS
jgi:methyl-accepting chemotaxis protein